MTVSLLCLLALALLAALIYRERANAAERQKLLDRIQAPESFQMAAVEAVIHARPAKEPTETWEPVPTDGDLALAGMLDRQGSF